MTDKTNTNADNDGDNTHLVASELAWTDGQIKALEKRKTELRRQLFDAATEEASHGVLGRKTVEIERGFLHKAGLSADEFLRTRYPGWRLLEVKAEATVIEYLIEEDPAYLNWSLITETDEGKIVKVGRTIQQNAPDLDQETLRRDLPEVYDKIMVPKIVYEPDAQAMEKLIRDDPSMISKLQLHMRYPAPTAKLLPIREVKDAEARGD